MVRLQDFDIAVAGVEYPRRLLDQADQHVEPKRITAGAHDGDRFRRSGDGGKLGGVEAGRADDQRRTTTRGAGLRQCSRGGRRGEVDNHIGH